MSLGTSALQMRGLSWGEGGCNRCCRRHVRGLCVRPNADHEGPSVGPLLGLRPFAGCNPLSISVEGPKAKGTRNVIFHQRHRTGCGCRQTALGRHETARRIAPVCASCKMGAADRLVVAFVAVLVVIRARGNRSGKQLAEPLASGAVFCRGRGHARGRLHLQRHCRRGY